MNLEDRLREELRREAGTAPRPQWEDVRARAAARKRRRQRVTYPIAVLAVVLAIVTGALTFAMVRDDDRVQRSVTASPTEGRAKQQIVAVTEAGRLVVLDAAGDEVRTLADGATGSLAVADGRVFFTRETDESTCAPFEIATVALEGGRATPLVGPAAWPAVSPDGSRLAYVSYDAPAGCSEPRSTIAVVPMNHVNMGDVSGAGGTWLTTTLGVIAPTWAPDSRTLGFVYSGPDGPSFRTLDAARPSATLDIAPAVPNLDVVPVGRRVVFSGNPSMLVAVVESEAGGPAVVSVDATTGEASDPLFRVGDNPLTAPGFLDIDQPGTSVLVTLEDEGDSDLYRWEDGDAEATEIADGIVAAVWVPLRQSRVPVPDRAVALTEDGRIVVIDARTGEERRTIARDALTGAEGGLAVSPDGNVVYFTRPVSASGCEAPQIVWAPTTGGGVEAVSPAAGYPVTGSHPLVSPDGQSLVLAGAPCGAPLLADLDLTNPAALPAMVPFAGTYERVEPLGWSADSARVVYRAALAGTADPRLFVTDRETAPIEVTASYAYSTATFRDEALIVAEVIGSGFRLVRFDEVLFPVVEELLVPRGDAPMSMEFDRSGRHLLYMTGSDEPVLHRWVKGKTEPIKLADGIVAAVWLEQ